MNIQYFLKLSFKALMDRKLKSTLTILMVVVGSSLMVSLNGLIAGLQSFVEGAFNKLAPNVLVVSSFLSHGRKHRLIPAVAGHGRHRAFIFWSGIIIYSYNKFRFYYNK